MVNGKNIKNDQNLILLKNDLSRKHSSKYLIGNTYIDIFINLDKQLIPKSSKFFF